MRPLADRVIVKLVEKEEKNNPASSCQTQLRKNLPKALWLQLVLVAF